MSAYPPEIVEFLGAEPTPDQWRAISWPLEPSVLVAGAGSGKTSVMAARVIWLALRFLQTGGEDGALPGNVLCLTFTNKATENLVLRIRRALAVLDLDEGEEPETLNYHGFAQQILDEAGEVCCEAQFTIGLFNLTTRRLIRPTPEWVKALGLRPEDLAAGRRPRRP